MNYLRHSIFWFIFSILLAWSAYGGTMGDVRDRKNCVSESIINAEEWQEKTGRPVKIAVFNVSKGLDHSQALGLDDDGYWKFLTRHHSDGLLRKWTRHYDKEPYRYLELNDWISEQEKVGQ